MDWLEFAPRFYGSSFGFFTVDCRQYSTSRLYQVHYLVDGSPFSKMSNSIEPTERTSVTVSFSSSSVTPLAVPGFIKHVSLNNREPKALN